MLRQLVVEGLKSFDDRQVIELAPITLVFGPNSAGKSTLLQSLMLMKQSIENQGPEEPLLVIRGPIVDLGSFRSAIHGHEDHRPLNLGLTFDPPDREQRPGRPRRPSAGGARTIEFEYRWNHQSDSVQLNRTLVEFERGFRGWFTREVRDEAATPLFGTPGSREFYVLRDLESRKSFANLLLQAERMRHMQGRPDREERIRRRAGQPEPAMNPEKIFQQLARELGDTAIPYFIGMGPFPFRLYDIDDLSGANPEGSGNQSLLHAWFERKGGEDARGLLNTTHFSLSNLFSGLFQESVELMTRTTYLGPLRRAPQRFHLFSGAHRESVGREGEFFTEILAQHPSVVDQANRWLKRLDIPYVMHVERLESDGALFETIGDVVSLVLEDTRSGVRVSPSDVGFGISQLLPIVVQSLFVESAAICIEQPEIHVHPRLQAELADMFMHAVEARGNQFIVETHSEHLMLRLQRRIREGKLDPDTVTTLYVDTDSEGRARVVPLALSDDGEFVDEWPRGFFEERFTEMFSR